jgi:EmrB/QacA subfamily drug resistance transporter
LNSSWSAVLLTAKAVQCNGSAAALSGPSSPRLGRRDTPEYEHQAKLKASCRSLSGAKFVLARSSRDAHRPGRLDERDNNNRAAALSARADRQDGRWALRTRDAESGPPPLGTELVSEIAAERSPTGRVEPLARKWWTLVIVCVAIFMLLLDITIVNVALPKIADSLSASFDQIQWVVNAYALTLAALLLTAGSLADQLGRKLVFTIGLGLFTVTSLLCAVSPTALFLILARGGQGVGGAIMFSTSLALLAQEFSGRERARALAIWGATTGVAVAVGPLLGGLLTEGLGWRSIFLINVPIGAVVLAFTVARVRETRDAVAKRVDWAGMVTFTAALFLLVMALEKGDRDGWGSATIIALLTGSVALLVVFWFAQTVQRDAMFDLSLFRSPSFSGASIAAFALSASAFSILLYVTLYLQTILGLSPLQAGLRLLPMTIAMFAVSAIAGGLTERVPVRALLGIGLGLVGGGLLLMRGLTLTSGWTALLAGFIVSGAGVGLVNPGLASAAIGVVPPQRTGMASGINSTFRQVGIAAGIASLGAVFQSQLASQLSSRLADSVAAGQAAHIARGVAAGAAQRILHSLSAPERFRAGRAINGAFAAALNEILLVSAIVAFAGAGLAFALVRQADFFSQTPQNPASAD